MTRGVRRTLSAGMALALLASVAVGVGGSPASAAATWTTVDLSAPGQNAVRPVVRVSADGTKATAVWLRSNGTNNVVQAASATINNGTATWSTVTTLSSSDKAALRPRLEMSDAGTTAIASWYRNNEAQSAVATVSGNTASWSSVTTFAAEVPIGGSVKTGVDISSDGTKAILLWADNVAGSAVVRSATATIAGNAATWSAASTVGTRGRAVAGAQIDVGLAANGSKATAVWASDDGNLSPFGQPSERVLAASATIASNAATWSAATELSGTGRRACSCVAQVAVSSDGTKATSVWSLNEDNGGAIVETASATISGSTASWSSVTKIAEAPTGDIVNVQHINDSFALSADGTKVTAVWVRYDTAVFPFTSTMQSASATVAGNVATWSAVNSLSDPAGFADYASMAMSTDGTRAVAVWGNFDSSDPVGVLSATSDISGNTATWSEPTALTGALTGQIEPVVAVSSDGSKATGAWEGNSGSNTVIQSGSVVYTVPLGVPTEVRATPGNSRMTVAWTAPSAGASGAPTGYTVTSSPGAKTCAATAPATSCSVTGLTNGTAYTFTVTATYGSGTSAASSPSSPVAPGLPAAPAIDSATAGNASVTVELTPPTTGGTPATYTVTSSPGAKTCTVTPPATTCSVTGLTNGTAYTFTAKSTNAAGISAASAPFGPVTPEFKVTWSSPPQDLSGTNGNEPQVSLSADGTKAIAIWNQYSNDYSASLIQYAIASIDGDSATWSPVVNLTTTGISIDAQVVLSDDGTKATAVWRTAGAVKSASATIVDTTATWSTASTLSTGDGADAPQLGLSTNGLNATVIWSRYDGTTYIVQSASATIVGNVADWSSPTTLSDSAQNAEKPQLGLSDNGAKATAVWIRYDGNDNIVQSASATISGKVASWSTPAANLSAADEDADVPQVAVSADGTLATAVWVRYNGSNTIVQSSSATIEGNVATWSTPAANLSAAGRDAENPQVALSDDGTKGMAVWSRSDGSDQIVQASSATIAGNVATWSTPAVDVSEAGQDAVYPQVTLSADGTASTVVWIRSGLTGIVQSSSASISGNTATWSVPGDVSGGEIDAYEPQVAGSTDGTNVTAVWRLDDGVVQTASALVPTSVPEVCGVIPTGFIDVPDTAYYARAASCLLIQGITTGVNNNPTTYGPDLQVSRAQMAAFLWRMAGEPAASTSCGFTDESSIPGYAREGACWLKDTGITTVNPYRPSGLVTRAQMAAFLWRFADSPATSPSCGFTDEASIPDFAREATCWLQDNGITTINPYRPSANVPRKEMAAFLYREGGVLSYWLTEQD